MTINIVRRLMEMPSVEPISYAHNMPPDPAEEAWFADTDYLDHDPLPADMDAPPPERPAPVSPWVQRALDHDLPAKELDA